jgi:hypothetical protein
MVPGVLSVFGDNLLKSAASDSYHALAFVSLCLIAATIGKPFIDFIQIEARWLMEERNRQRIGAKKGIDEANEKLLELQRKIEGLDKKIP